MDQVAVRTNVLQANQETAMRNRELFERERITAINLMSAPGAGKTTLLEATIQALRSQYRMAVIEGDLQTELDAERIRAMGIPSHQITTGTVCHLDARMIDRALAAFPVKDVELLFIENVGNLICPASYDLGEKLRVVVCSVAEGADKPKKYPVMFHKADAIVINKADLALPGGGGDRRIAPKRSRSELQSFAIRGVMQDRRRIGKLVRVVAPSHRGAQSGGSGWEPGMTIAETIRSERRPLTQLSSSAGELAR